MKTIKASLFILVGSLAATASFAQVGLGATKSVNAAATHGATRSAAQAATRGTVHASTNSAVNGAKVTGAANNAANKTINTTTTVKNGVKNNADVNARVKSQASVHASEQAKANANENSAIFGAKADGSTSTDAGVRVNGKSAIDKTEENATEVTNTTKAKKDATVTKSEKVKSKSREKSCQGC
jgi:hypothetical protein